MPRPGPRPFECVRRAWHSDRHQPIRGSLIQEIFRVVNEIHSSATRSNREWQEKLPIVVLKAEEIIYSKANSEVEYSDLTTVWDRTNDAINTIIRLDESTETGELLRPCIEAALVLGSIPRRPSRSQRNYNPKCYLTPSTPESAYVPPTSLKNVIQTDHITNSPFVDSNLKHYPSWSQNIPRNLPKETNTTKSCSIYPLYYGTQLQSQQPELSCPIAPMKESENPEPSTTIFLETLSLCDFDVSKEIPQSQLKSKPENFPEVQCDLSLRLGPVSSPSTSIKSCCPREVEKSRSSDLTPLVDKEFSFFPIHEDSPEEISIRKRKIPYSSPSEDRHSFWQPKLPCNQFYGKSRNAETRIISKLSWNQSGKGARIMIVPASLKGATFQKGSKPCGLGKRKREKVKVVKAKLGIIVWGPLKHNGYVKYKIWPVPTPFKYLGFHLIRVS